MHYTRSKTGSVYHLATCRHANHKIPWLWGEGKTPQQLWESISAVGSFGPHWNVPCYFCLGIWHAEAQRSFRGTP
jgi:hypothetical protein